MRNGTELDNLFKERKQLDKAIDELFNTLSEDRWTFCIHLHYLHIHVSVWEYVDDPSINSNSASFRIIDNEVTLIKKGDYAEHCEEIKTAITDWLTSDLAGAEKESIKGTTK